MSQLRWIIFTKCDKLRLTALSCLEVKGGGYLWVILNTPGDFIMRAKELNEFF